MIINSRNNSDQTDLTGVMAAPAAPVRLVSTMRKTAGLSGISYSSVVRLVERGKLRANKSLPGRVRIPAREIENFLNCAS